MEMTITQIAAWVATIGFIAMIAFQVSLALGFPFGQAAWGGKHKVLPRNLRIGSTVSAGIFVFASISVLERAGILSLLNSPKLVTYVVWILVAFLGLSAIGNLASSSQLEKRIMAPLALTLSLMCLIVAITAA